MNLSRDSVLALQRHFLGALSTPTRAWLEPLPAPLTFAGRDIRSRREGCVLDLGRVVSPGEARSIVRVFHRDGRKIELVDQPIWLALRWLDATSLEVRIPHEAEREFRGIIRFRVDQRVEELSIRMASRSSHPVAQFRFNGSAHSDAFEFSDENRLYELSVTSETSLPIVVAFADLPGFLSFEVDGQSRSGPLPGPFFERAAPFTVKLRPCRFGLHEGALRVRTNDSRPELQDFALTFSASVAAAKPRVSAIAPPRVRMRSDQTFTANVRLENWGRVVGRTSRHTVPRFLSVREWPVIPAAQVNQAGSALLPVHIAPARLAPGEHVLTLSVKIDGGEPATVDVPVVLDVLPARKAALRPQTVAVLFALLLLTLFVIVARGVL